MVDNNVRVRVLPSGMYGTADGSSVGDDHCKVYVDEWQFDSRSDRDEWYENGCDEFGNMEYPAAQVEELIEVSPSGRLELFEDFDTIVIQSILYPDYSGSSSNVVIRRKYKAVELSYTSFDFEVRRRATLKGARAVGLLSSLFATHAEQWVKPFICDCGPSDGCSWTLTAYSGNRFFDCSGSNAAPRELVHFLYAIANMGMPFAWDGNDFMLKFAVPPF